MIVQLEGIPELHIDVDDGNDGDNKKDIYYVPRAPSLCEARTRASIFMKHLGIEPLIVNPQTWEILCLEFKTTPLYVDITSGKL